LTALVLDASAIVAVLFKEPDAGGIRATLASYPVRHISDVTVFELQVVLHRRWGAVGPVKAQSFLARMSVSRVPFDQRASDEAFAAYRRYGKGCGHPAQLSICDCAAYATGKILNAPLLFKGNDFTQTDVLLP
jgi:ribonuclease VapC